MNKKQALHEIYAEWRKNLTDEEIEQKWKNAYPTLSFKEKVDFDMNIPKRPYKTKDQ